MAAQIKIMSRALQFINEIKFLNNQIEDLDILNNITEENIDKRNKILLEIHLLRKKIKNIYNNIPENGYWDLPNLEISIN